LAAEHWKGATTTVFQRLLADPRVKKIVLRRGNHLDVYASKLRADKVGGARQLQSRRVACCCCHRCCRRSHWLYFNRHCKHLQCSSHTIASHQITKPPFCSRGGPQTGAYIGKRLDQVPLEVDLAAFQGFVTHYDKVSPWASNHPQSNSSVSSDVDPRALYSARKSKRWFWNAVQACANVRACIAATLR
jgi:hypothetical protein